MNISLAMAVYNGERFIREQFESLLQQTRLPDELVVSDDSSTDRTVEIVRAFASQVPFPVRLLINDQNVGCTKNYERAIRECSGDIIFLCDSDDVWYPNRIAITEEALDKHPKAGIAICDADLVDERSWPLGQRLWPWRGFNRSPEIAGLADGTTFDRSIPCYGPSIAFRGRFKDLVLPLPDGPTFRIAGQDTFITWCIVGAGAGGIVLINEPLLGYRQHSTQMTKQIQDIHLPRWTARTQRPLTFLIPLIERLESDAARAACVNPQMRDAALKHWRSRCFFSSNKIRRVPIVMREYLSGRYDEFADGLKTAVKDLLFVR
jgi:hypothetical protein